MSGRRNAGGAATLVGNMILKDREHRIENDSKRVEFDRRLQQALTVEDYKAQIQDRRTQQNNANVDQLLQQSHVGQASQQSQLPGMPSQGQGVQAAQGSGGFDTSDMDYRITIDSSGRKSVVFTPKKQPKQQQLTPQNQLFQDTRQANETLQRNQSLPSSTFIPEARQQLINTLPQGPFVQGPEGSLLSGQNMETMPGQAIDRGQVVSQMAPGLAEQMAPGLRQPMVDQAQNNLNGLLQTRQMLQPPKADRAVSDTVQFREDLQNGLKAISERKIGKQQAIQRLLRAYPDKADRINKLIEELL